MLNPAYNYLLVKPIVKDTGIVLEDDIEDTHQHFVIVGVADDQGYMDGGAKVITKYRVGETIYVQKHADADTPKELENKGMALIQISRVMAWEGEAL